MSSLIYNFKCLLDSCLKTSQICIRKKAVAEYKNEQLTEKCVALRFRNE